jgi:HPt (histidine-containing phosphotransfer) domain-containing protein
LSEAIENKDYDLNYLKGFGRGDSFELMLINLFITSSEEDLKLFNKALENEDWSELGDLAHKMRSRSQHFKMTKLISMLRDIEEQCVQLKFKNDFKEHTLVMIVYYFEIIELLTQESLTLNKSKGKAGI